MTQTTYCRRTAMGTYFEVFLAGEEEEHLQAVANAVLEEVVRVERLLSRFDQASEIFRINLRAGRQPVLVDFEVWDILRTCQAWHQQTGGYFDIAMRRSSDRADRVAADVSLILDDVGRTVLFTQPDTSIDLGGFGKGYALDRAREVLRAFQVHAGLLHGGTSSILTIGKHPAGHPWPIDIRDPFANAKGESAPWEQLRLSDQGFSCSAILASGQHTSDIIDPLRQAPLTEQAACVVVAPTALEAEILSTACLSMGKERAVRYTGREDRAGLHVGWIDQCDGRPRLTWLTEKP